ncbi:MAG: pyruvate ferredoxin oxidoreductase [candidate division Zixibacteria bacterium RBG_16_43_9]|nr:MAG: pyruvate ferredoxin oxidoreductase [candidate division Zixibacteria bacterium RBG_16_43_9]
MAKDELTVEKKIKEKEEIVESLLTPGHKACSGCGLALAARTVMNTAGKDIIVTAATGCLEVFSTSYPHSAWKMPWIHSLFENSAAVAAGIEVALKALGREKEAKIIAQGGDGATADIGIGCLSGMFERGHNILYVCYDNEAYMNTGVQRSSLTPFEAWTSTSPSGKVSWGNPTEKKNMPAIAAAHGIPYVATASVAYLKDLEKKVKKALDIVGPKYLQIHAPCPLGWAHEPYDTIKVAKLAVQTGLIPLYEMENGVITSVRKIAKKAPVEEYLKLQGRFRHLFKKPGFEKELERIQAMADATIKKFNLM